MKHRALTPTQVTEIRHICLTNLLVTHSELAAIYGVDLSVIEGIVDSIVLEAMLNRQGTRA